MKLIKKVNFILYFQWSIKLWFLMISLQHIYTFNRFVENHIKLKAVHCIINFLKLSLHSKDADLAVKKHKTYTVCELRAGFVFILFAESCSMQWVVNKWIWMHHVVMTILTLHILLSSRRSLWYLRHYHVLRDKPTECVYWHQTSSIH